MPPFVNNVLRKSEKKWTWDGSGQDGNIPQWGITLPLGVVNIQGRVCPGAPYIHHVNSSLVTESQLGKCYLTKLTGTL